MVDFKDMTDLTFDPTDWPAFRQLAHQMVDDMLTHFETLRDKPAWRDMPPAIRESFNAPMPTRGAGDEKAYAEFRDRVMPYTNGNLHPHFWGWVQGNGTPLGMMADMLAAGINPHMAVVNQAPGQVELEVVRWLSEMLGMPTGMSGLFVTGGTMANTLGLAVARHAGALAAGYDSREDGMQSDGDTAPRPRLVFYGSSETHNWARKAAELLGLGNRSFRRVPVDDEYRIDLAALAEMVRTDRAAGLRPFAVIGTAGTVNTGATDDLDAIADLCEREKLWFHVDGAFGALAWLSPSLRPMLAGMQRADSLAFDLHKWGSLPYECACVLVRDEQKHHATFAASASYIDPTARGVIAGGLPFADRGLELTRNFKALKVWMSLIANGVDGLSAMIEQNLRHTRDFVARVESDTALELLAPVPMNVVCFRFVAPDVNEEALNAINAEILLRVQERGIAVPSGTVLRGRYALRIANVNHRTRHGDLEGLADAVVAIGREVLAERS